MLELTANASVNGVRFDGIDLFLSVPHQDLESTDDDLKQLADKVGSKGLAIGSLVAPIWGGGGAFGTDEDRKNYLTALRKSCAIGKKLKDIGIRKYGIHPPGHRQQPRQLRQGSGGQPEAEHRDLQGGRQDRRRLRRTAGPRRRNLLGRHAQLEIACWRSWKASNNPKTVGIQADMAHTLLFMLGLQRPRGTASFPRNSTGRRPPSTRRYKKLTDELRPWAMDFHVAQNDATVFGSGTHDKTGRHCLVDDQNGKLDIPYHAGFWLRDDNGQAHRHQAHVLGRLHVPERGDGAAGDLEQDPGRDERGPGKARLELKPNPSRKGQKGLKGQ